MATGFKPTQRYDLPDGPGNRPSVPCCKRCGESKVVRHGHTRAGTQRLRCKACGATFLGNAAPPRMRFPAETIAAALQAFYGGATLEDIADTLASCGESAPNYATIQRWIVRFTTVAVEALAEPIPDVGDAWLAIESRVESRAFAGRPVWLWDVFDSHSGYLLGSKLSSSQQDSGPKPVLHLAARRAGGQETETDGRGDLDARWLYGWPYEWLRESPNESASETAPGQEARCGSRHYPRAHIPAGDGGVAPRLQPVPYPARVERPYTCQNGERQREVRKLGNGRRGFVARPPTPGPGAWGSGGLGWHNQ